MSKATRARMSQQRPLLPDRVSPSDLKYLLRVRADMRRVPEIIQQIEQLQAAVSGIQGSLEHFGAHLAEEYGMNQQTDQVGDDGSIVRADPRQQIREVPVAPVAPPVTPE